jgi:hypothetical protein
LSERLGVLGGGGALNIGRCIKGYSGVLSLDIVPSESFTRHDLPALANVQEAMYTLLAPRKLLTVTSEYGPSCIFYTDGSLI